MRTVTAIYTGLPHIKTTHLEEKGLPKCLIAYNKIAFKNWKWEYEEGQAITCPDCQQLLEKEEATALIATTSYYTIPTPHKTIKDALHSYDLTFTEVGIFIFLLDANRAITVDDLRLFSPTDGVAVLQPALDELVRLGFLERQES